MTVEISKPNPWTYAAAIVLAFIGALIAVVASQMIYNDQARMPGASVWPLPGLVLMDWAILGVLGFFGAYYSRKPSAARWRKIVWFTVGGLIPLVILGALSIGPFVLVSLLFLLAAAILITVQEKRWLEHMGLLMLGAVCNLGLLFLFIALGSPTVSF